MIGGDPSHYVDLWVSDFIPTGYFVSNINILTARKLPENVLLNKFIIVLKAQIFYELNHIHIAAKHGMSKPCHTYTQTHDDIYPVNRIHSSITHDLDNVIYSHIFF